MAVYWRYISIVLALLLCVSCYPLKEKKAIRPADSLKRVRFFWPEFGDDMDTRSLASAVKRSLKYLNRLDEDRIFTFGPDEYTARHIKESLRSFLQLVKENPNTEEFNRRLKKNFFLYKSPGSGSDGEVLFTGYYEPCFKGSLEKDSVYRYPIYKRPEDLVHIDLGAFHPKFHGKRIMARIQDNKVVPYYSRKDIIKEEVLREKDLEIAWLKDPLDVAILQIQGSGIIELPDGRKIKVGYAGWNGHPYRSIGKYMIDNGYIEYEKLSMQSIRYYLKNHPGIKNQILGHNPSYVFFQVLKKGPLGNINVKLTPGRSLALDDFLFPKGCLAYIRCKRPVLGESGSITGWIPFSRFMLNQDTGGVIKGPGRADIFWGSNPYAELAAGHLKHWGDLYFLVKKPNP